MLDTVIMNIPLEKVDIRKPEMFTPNAQTILDTYGYGKAVNNPSKEESKWEYFPRMTLYRRYTNAGVMAGLKIEFSAPKILFQNNLDEVEEKDFEKVVIELQRKLLMKGVYIMREDLESGNVSAFHASKNIELSGYTTATMVINDLAKVQLTRRMDLNKTDFRNGGHSLQYYSISHSLVFYDKIADMGKDGKRSIDKEVKSVQKSLFHEIKELRRSTDVEILKMEVRLSQKRKMDSILEKLGYKKSPTFRDIFREDVCKKVLLDYWNMLVQAKNNFLFQQDKNKQDKFIDIADSISRNNGKPVKAVALMGINDFCKSEGVQLFRQIIEDKFGKGSWNNMNKYLKELNAISSSSNSLPQDFYSKDIIEALNKFEVFKKASIKASNEGQL